MQCVGLMVLQKQHFQTTPQVTCVYIGWEGGRRGGVCNCTSARKLGLFVFWGGWVFSSLTVQCVVLLVSPKQHFQTTRQVTCVYIKGVRGWRGIECSCTSAREVGGGGDVVGCFTSLQLPGCLSAVCLSSCSCCHTEIEVADPCCSPIQSQYTDTGRPGPCTDPITPGAW